MIANRAYRAVVVAMAGAIGLSTLAACASTTSGSGSHVAISTGSSRSPSGASSSASTSTPGLPPTSATATAAPGKPLKTVTIPAGNRTYIVQIWADRSDRDCAAHAYGAPIIAFLRAHPCYNGLNRKLGTLTFNGRTAGFAQSTLAVPTPSGQQPYKYSEEFRRLLVADNTGSITDLLHDGYRLPSGPTAIPANEAFRVVGQDSGIEIWDAWYLDGPTKPDDPALMQAALDTFLQY